MPHTLQSALDSGQEAKIVQIDSSAAFDRVNHQGILYMLCSVGTGGSVLSLQRRFLSNRSQHFMVDGCQSKQVVIIIKTGSTGPSGKNKIVYKLLSQLHKHLRHRKPKNKLREATND